jgi:hypothetical protein
VCLVKASLFHIGQQDFFSHLTLSSTGWTDLHIACQLWGNLTTESQLLLVGPQKQSNQLLSVTNYTPPVIIDASQK